MSVAGKKILIADDDSSIRLVLSQSFTRLGYQVRATGNATTLLKWVSDGEGDLVITDVMMPDENVFDVLPRIRKERPKLPVIVMSANNTLLTAVNAAEIGAFDYVPKPFDLDDMTNAARRALSRPADAEASRAQARAMRDERLPLIGRSASELNLRSRYHVNLLALSRQGRRSIGRLRRTRFAAGDVLLVQGAPEAVAVLERFFPKILKNPALQMTAAMTLRQVAGFAQSGLTADSLAEIDAQLRALPSSDA